MAESYEQEMEQLTEPVKDEDGYQFVNVASDEDSDVMELPAEKNGTILLSTIQAQFPEAIGLKYKSSSGGLRGIRAENNILDPPHGGWGVTTYLVTGSAPTKRKAAEPLPDVKVSKSKKERDYLGDLIVLGLPYTTTELELEDYFTKNCGELAFHELKYNRETKKTRGFGFIRFQTEEGAKAALISGAHTIEGRKLEIRLSRNKEESFKVFVGKLPETATQSIVTKYFSEYGDLEDVFVPNPWRGFAFVTFASKDDARVALNGSHHIQGSRITVTVAEPKKQNPQQAERHHSNNSQENSRGSNYKTDSNGYSAEYGNRPAYDNKPSYDNRPAEPSQSKDVTSQLKDMLYTLIQNQQK